MGLKQKVICLTYVDGGYGLPSGDYAHEKEMLAVTDQGKIYQYKSWLVDRPHGGHELVSEWREIELPAPLPTLDTGESV